MKLEEIMVRPDWWERAACRGLPPDLFHPERNEWEKRQRALEVCASCPVLDECRTEVLGRKLNPVGIVGGLSEAQRAELRSPGGVRPLVCVDCGETFGESKAKGHARARRCKTCRRAHATALQREASRGHYEAVHRLPCVVCGVTERTRGHDTVDLTCGRWECRSALRRRRSNAIVWGDNDTLDGMDDAGAVA